MAKYTKDELGLVVAVENGEFKSVANLKKELGSIKQAVKKPLPRPKVSISA